MWDSIRQVARFEAASAWTFGLLLAGRVALVIGLVEFAAPFLVDSDPFSLEINIACVAIAIFTFYLERRPFNKPSPNVKFPVVGMEAADGIPNQRIGFDLVGGSLKAKGTRIIGMDKGIQARNSTFELRDTEIR